MVLGRSDHGRYRHRVPSSSDRQRAAGNSGPPPAVAAGREGLSVGDPHFFGSSYARTLGEWRTRFEAALPDVRELGFDERFVRMWRYYLAYCKAGFSAGTIDVMQIGLGR